MTTHNEDIWTCNKCGKQFGRHDMWFDGLCGECKDIETVEIHRMVVACTNLCGEPDLAMVKVKTHGNNAVDEGIDVDLAEKWAIENGYEAPFVVFNCDHNSAGLGIAYNFAWDTATVYEG